MTCYLFVPGGKRSKEDWDNVRPLLERQHHQTRAITLTDPEHATLEEHISQVVALIKRLPRGNLHLVGHSYASFVITGAADRLPGQISRLVFLDSSIPVSGLSLLDFFSREGMDPGLWGIPDWPPFTTPLIFDQSRLNRISKTYIHCLRSRFLQLGEEFARQVQARMQEEHWSYFELDSGHYPMLDDPEGLVACLLFP